MTSAGSTSRYLRQNAAAFRAGSSSFNFEAGGLRLPGTKTTDHRVWCLQDLRRQYLALAADVQATVRTFLGPRDGARFEADDDARGAGRHLRVARLAPGHLQQRRALHADEAPADDHPVDVHREEPAIPRLLARRACDLVPDGGVVERVTHWEEGRALGLEVAESDWPIRYMRWVTRVEAEGDGARITQELEYELTFGLLGRALDAMVMRRKLTATLDAVFASLVRHAEGAS